MSDQQSGNGNGDNTNPIHEDFINSAPEELRDAAAELAPVWDSYVQKQFTEAAEFRKQYEPFAELPMDKVTPEDIQDYLAFKEIQADPAALKAWHEQWGNTLRTDHPELFDDDGTFVGETDPRIAAELASVKQQLAEVTNWKQEQAQTEAANQATAFVNTQITEIKSDFPDLSDDDVDSICVLATKYIPKDGTQPPEDFIKQGFKDFQRIVGQTERELFTKKENQPTPAMHGGRASTTPSPITSFEGANEAARRAILESIKSR